MINLSDEQVERLVKYDGMYKILISDIPHRIGCFYPEELEITEQYYRYSGNYEYRPWFPDTLTIEEAIENRGI